MDKIRTDDKVHFLLMATRQDLDIRDVGKQMHATIRIVESIFTSSVKCSLRGLDLILVRGLSKVC